MTHAVAQRIVAVALAAVPLTFVGCEAGKAASDGDRPGVIAPTKGTQTNADGSATAAKSDTVVARLETVTVSQSELVPLLYDAYGLDGLLKLLQRNLARAESTRRGLTVSPTDIDAERKLTLKLAFPGQEEADYDNLLKQLLERERVSRAEFDIVMDTNAHLRACVRGQAGSDVTAEAIRNEFNLIYGERVRVRDIPVENPQQAAEVQRLLAEPGARFETIARSMGKIPELAQLGGQLPEFSRTSTTWSSVFVEAAFGLQVGQISDPILEKNFYHILKLEDRIAPKAVKFEAVENDVREQLIVRRMNAMMAAMRQEFAQRALRELKIEDPSIRRTFEERLARANPQADRAAVQRDLAQRDAHPDPTTAPTTQSAAAPATKPSPAVAPLTPPKPTPTTTTAPAAR